MSGGLSAALAALRPRTRQGFRAIFDTHLASTTDLVRQNPGDAEAWVRAVVTYHLIVEGYLALTGQRTLLRVLRNASLLPGFYAGFTAVARDESRHLGFGVAALRRRIQKDPAMAGIILDQVHLLIEPAVHTVVGPDQQLPFEDPHEIPEPMRVGPYEVRGFAQGSLRKRLQALGIEQSAIEELELRGNRIFEDAWTRYEQVHRVRHPVRFYDNSGTLLAG
jgi:ribonucleoside-diphosphate reductase beta chain